MRTRGGDIELGSRTGRPVWGGVSRVARSVSESVGQLFIARSAALVAGGVPIPIQRVQSDGPMVTGLSRPLPPDLTRFSTPHLL